MKPKKNMSGVVNKVSSLSSVAMSRVLISEVSQKHGQSFKAIILSGYSTRVFSVCLHLCLGFFLWSSREENKIIQKFHIALLLQFQCFYSLHEIESRSPAKKKLTCSKPTTETLEKRVKYVQSQQ